MYSCHSILELYNLFSRVKLSIKIVLCYYQYQAGGVEEGEGGGGRVSVQRHG